MNSIAKINLPSDESVLDALVSVSDGLIIPVTMTEPLRHATKIIIVVGSENLATAAEHSPRGSAAVGLDTIYKWRSVTGTPLSQLNGLITGSTTFYIYAHGRTKDADIYEEVQSLKRHIERAGAEAVYLLDDDVAELSDMVTSSAYLDHMFTSSVTNTSGAKPGKKQAVSKVAKALAPFTDVDEASTYLVDASGGNTPLMSAAIVHNRSYRLQDDLRDTAGEGITRLHDVTVSYVYMGRHYDTPVLNVPAADLGNARKILNRVMTPGADTILISPHPGVNAALENAIRNSNPEALETPIYRRTGWLSIDGTFGFMHRGGWITGAGNQETTRSQLSKVWNMLTFPNPVGGQVELDAAAHALKMRAVFALNPNIWVGFMGGLIHSAAGLGVGACISFFGANGSGKSNSTENLTSFLSRQLSNGPMATVDSSAAHIRRVGGGLDSLILVIDDKRESGSKRMLDESKAAIEAIVRPSYSGHAAQKAVNEKDESGTYGLAAAEMSDYIRVLVGEQMPEEDEENSTRERLYPVMTDTLTTFASGNSEVLDELANSDLPQLHFAHFLRWVAEGMDRAGSREDWVASWGDVKRALYDRMKPMPIARRVYEVGCVPLLGIIIHASYLRSINAITVQEHDVMVEEATVVAEKNVLWHGTYNVNETGSDADKLLESIRQILAGRHGYIRTTMGLIHSESGLLRLSDAASKAIPGKLHALFTPQDRHAPVFGDMVHGRGGNGDYVAILPQTLQSLLQHHGKTDLSVRALAKKLAPLTVNTDGTPLPNRVRIIGVLTSVISLPLEALILGYATGDVRLVSASEIDADVAADWEQEA